MSTEKRVGVWDAVAQIVNNGQAPRIRLHPSAEILPITRKERTSFRDPVNPYAHYATSRMGRSRPRCLACKKHLRVKDVEVCSTDCARYFCEWAKAKLVRVENGKIRIPITEQTARMLGAA